MSHFTRMKSKAWRYSYHCTATYMVSVLADMYSTKKVPLKTISRNEEGGSGMPLQTIPSASKQGWHYHQAATQEMQWKLWEGGMPIYFNKQHAQCQKHNSRGINISHKLFICCRAVHIIATQIIYGHILARKSILDTQVVPYLSSWEGGGSITVVDIGRRDFQLSCHITLPTRPTVCLSWCTLPSGWMVLLQH